MTLSPKAQQCLSGIRQPENRDLLLNVFRTGAPMVSAEVPVGLIATVLILATIGKFIHGADIVDDWESLRRRFIDVSEKADISGRLHTGERISSWDVHLAYTWSRADAVKIKTYIDNAPEARSWLPVWDELINLA